MVTTSKCPYTQTILDRDAESHERYTKNGGFFSNAKEEAEMDVDDARYFALLHIACGTCTDPVNCARVTLGKNPIPDAATENK